MEASDIQKIKNLRTRTGVSNRCLPILALRAGRRKILSKKALKPAFKRELVTHLITTSGLSIWHACRSRSLSVTVRIPRVTNPLLSRSRQWQCYTLVTVFQNFSLLCGVWYTRGITKGSIVFIVC